jgi:hypothetical protein
VSVTRTTIEATIRKLEVGDWEALSAIDQYRVRIRNLRTGSRSPSASSTTGTCWNTASRRGRSAEFGEQRCIVPLGMDVTVNKRLVALVDRIDIATRLCRDVLVHCLHDV